jgi:ABC-type iron transport system FetAB ATPase subunit
MRIVGILLILAGLLLFMFNRLEYQGDKTVLEAGNIEIKKKETKYITWPSAAGGISVIAGIVLLLKGRKQ